MVVSVVLIPANESVPLQSRNVSWNEVRNPDDDGSVLPSIKSMLLIGVDSQDDTTPASNNSNDCGDPVEIPLLRPLQESPGLYAYYLYDPTTTTNSSKAPNIRATRLAMACGLLSMRLAGNILVVRSHPTRKPHWQSLAVEEIFGACEVSPDLRPSVQKELSKEGTPARVPAWLANAAQQTYHDSAAVSRMAEVMKHDKIDDDGDDHDGSDNSKNVDDENDSDEDHVNQPQTSNQESLDATIPAEFVAKSPLCLHCRRPTTNLCPECQGAYFCSPPRDCRRIGWSHSCQCQTWNLYVSHRETLSTVEYLDSAWQSLLVQRNFQTSEEPYKEFLATKVGVNFDNVKTSWWRTETDGWAGGQSASARQVDPTVRQSYEEGFAPLALDQIPKQRPTKQDYQEARLHKKNVVGLWKLDSWQDYYKLRDIPPSSPVALLCTFPLTVYRAIEQYGEVPATVAQMLKRPLRIHVVGAEKEMNFLDLFQEVGYLLPENLQVELVFVVRQDMLPSHCCSTGDKYSLQIELTTNLTVQVVSGTYGTNQSSTASSSYLDPNFDVGKGPPDMVLALNAGLYAYESWRSVVDYLYHNSGVVGVFTDYNEYSGMNCASIGGAASRESLTINPFRQPLAMPVYSMNLPQFSNGFFYVFNAQELE